LPNPTYTVMPQNVASATSEPIAIAVEASPVALLDRWLATPVARSRRTQLGIDLAMVAITVLTFARVWEPDVPFHVIFVLLVVHAFLFGFRGTIVRIALASVAVLAYAFGGAFGLGLEQNDLAEWPLMFLIAILVALMADWRASSSRHFEALFRQASTRLLEVQEDERRRFARELHDGVGQTLTALMLAIDATDGGGLSPTVRKERTASVRRLAHDALLETHDLATRVRPARIEQLGLAGALRDLATRAGCQVALDIQPEAATASLLPPSASVEVFRIAQEALANVVRHSGSGHADVRLGVEGDRVRLEVEDAGSGFDAVASTGDGLGLPGMRERAALLGATLTISSRAGRGTLVTLLVPFSNDPGVAS
jgi:two-component system, NarL family, sensor histidine kinase UhpB